MGCPRAAGAKYLGLTPEELEAEAARDETLAKELLRAEGTAVLLHMGNVRKAANDEKNWRTSVWWLEQQARLDKATGPAGPSLQEAVREALERFAELIVNEIPDVERRQRVLTQLINITTECTGAIGQSQVIDVEPTLLTASHAAGAMGEIAGGEEAGE
ncbi:MAG: hypothetical protein C0485_00085 [Pirellula sp.]|nr:hypothetical protein [Pirellula sp.]